MATKTKKRFHKGSDGWGRDSYEIPTYAVAGCSCTGEGGPAPEATARREMEALQGVLEDAGIKSCFKGTPSGNYFMVKVWVCVTASNYDRAKIVADQWLADHQGDTRLIHDAD